MATKEQAQAYADTAIAQYQQAQSLGIHTAGQTIWTGDWNIRYKWARKDKIEWFALDRQNEIRQKIIGDAMAKSAVSRSQPAPSAPVYSGPPASPTAASEGKSSVGKAHAVRGGLALGTLTDAQHRAEELGIKLDKGFDWKRNRPIHKTDDELWKEIKTSELGKATTSVQKQAAELGIPLDRKGWQIKSDAELQVEIEALQQELARREEEKIALLRAEEQKRLAALGDSRYTSSQTQSEPVTVGLGTYTGEERYGEPGDSLEAPLLGGAMAPSGLAPAGAENTTSAAAVTAKADTTAMGSGNAWGDIAKNVTIGVLVGVILHMATGEKSRS